MHRLTLWYANLSRGAKAGLWAGMGVLAAMIVIAIAWMTLTPDKVMVRYGTIVRDPIDNYVWEDNTQTAWVDPSEAGNYKVEYVDRYSPEHEEQLRKEQEELAAKEEELAKSTGMQALETAIPSETFQDLNTLQKNIDVMGQDIITGMEMANEISRTKSTLVSYRNQVAGIALAPELEPMRQQVLQIFDLYIKACDLYMQAIATGDLALVDEANALIKQAGEAIQALMPSK
ncbi:MAG: hypothetical protein H5T73_06220 [Actinobacteria bacterium]|nr:hypothetical protein [Actinomycetota bacterium]